MILINSTTEPKENIKLLCELNSIFSQIEHSIYEKINDIVEEIQEDTMLCDVKVEIYNQYDNEYYISIVVEMVNEKLNDETIKEIMKVTGTTNCVLNSKYNVLMKNECQSDYNYNFSGIVNLEK